MGEFGNTRKLDRHGGWVSGSTGPVEKVGIGEQITLQFLFPYKICKRHRKAKREITLEMNLNITRNQRHLAFFIIDCDWSKLGAFLRKYFRVWNRSRAGNNRRAWKICQKE